MDPIGTALHALDRAAPGLPQVYREVWEYPRRAWWRVIWTFLVSMAAWCAVLIVFILIIGARA